MSGELSQSDNIPAAWGTVGILGTLYIISIIDRNLMALLVESIKLDLRITDVEIGLVFGTAFGLFYLLAALPLGWALDRFNRRVVIYLGVTVWSIGTTLCGLAGNVAQLFAARALVGAGEAVVVPGSHSIIAETFPPDRLALPLSIFSIGGKLGIGVSFMVGGLLTMLIDPKSSYAVPILGTLSGWQIIFMVVGLPGLALALLVFLIPAPAAPSGATKRASLTDYAAILRSGAGFFLCHHLGSMLVMASMAAIVVWTPAYLERAHNLLTSEAGIMLSLALTVGPIMGMPVHGYLADRLYRRGHATAHMAYMAGAIAIGCPLVVAAYLMSAPLLMLVVLACGVTMLACYLGLPPTALQLNVPRQFRATASSVLTVFMACGTMVGSSLPPIVNRFAGDDPTQLGEAMSILLAITLPLAAILFLAAGRYLRHHGEAGHLVPADKLAV